MREKRNNSFYLSIVVIFCISAGAGAYIYHSLSQLGKDLTDEFHETYFHSNKLELDTAKLRLLVEQFSNTPSEEIYAALVEAIDLIYLRVGVVVKSSEYFSPAINDVSTKLYPHLELIDAKILAGREKAHLALSDIKNGLSGLVASEQEVSRLFNIHVQRSISDANRTIDHEIRLIVTFFTLMVILLITLVILFYRKSAIAAELKRSKENLRRIVDRIPHRICVRDSMGKIVLANETVAREFGISVPELTGLYYADVHPDRAKAEQILADDQLVISQQKAILDAEDIVEEKNGRKRWYSVSKLPFASKNDNSKLILSITQDLTTQKSAELRVRSSEERLQLALEGADLGLWDWNLKTGVAHYSDRYYTMLGYAVGEPGEEIKLYEKLIHPDDLQRVKEELKNYLSCNSGNWSIQYRLRKKDGNYSWILNHGKVVECDTGGIPLRAAGTHLDITLTVEASEDKQLLEAQLAQARKMEAIGTLAGGIAHDFNNILTAILGFSELARNGMEEGSQPRANLEKVLTAGNRAKDLVKNILTFSRTSSQLRQPVELQVLLKDVIDLMRASLPSTIEIRLHQDGGFGQILADHNQIHQILMNLCTNAAQAMGETGGLLELSLVQEQLTEEDVVGEPGLTVGSYLHLLVSDNGPGIDPAIIDRIFDPYFTTKEVGKGSGMGLAIVKGIVTSHEGVVWADSEKGKGTTFHLYFPEISAPAVEARAAEVVLQRGRETLLVVDDELMIVEMLKMLFSELGYRVFATTNPLGAMDIFSQRNQEIDLVITDQTMPKLTGEILAGRMLEISPEIPIILCTGYSEKMSEAHCSQLGIAKLVLKPVDTAYLSQVVRQLLDKKRHTIDT